MSKEKEALLRELTILDFAAVDLQLFLNTHPTDADALQMYNDCTENARQVRERYEQQFGPLTSFRAPSHNTWQWSEEPWPWQAEANFKIREAH